MPILQGHPRQALLSALPPGRVSLRAASADDSVDQQRYLKSQLSDQIKVITRRCAVQEQAAARWRELRAEIALQEQRIAELQNRLKPIRPDIKLERTSTPRGDPVSTLRARLDSVKAQQRIIDQRLATARRVLVLEASGIMGLERGRIAGLDLLAPREMKRASRPY
jgi:predicted RNase H-like nuclease (RuvC/YqgF family)